MVRDALNGVDDIAIREDVSVVAPNTGHRAVDAVSGADVAMVGSVPFGTESRCRHDDKTHLSK